MNSLFAAVARDGNMKKLIDVMGNRARTVVCGLTGSPKYTAVAAAWDKTPQELAVIVKDHETLEEWRSDLAALLPQAEIKELPELDFWQEQTSAKSLELSSLRMDILSRLLRRDNIILLATAEAAAHPVPSAEKFGRLSVKISVGDRVDPTQLRVNLVNLGYERADEVENIGQFSFRGGILDIFPLNAASPLRVEFFDDDVNSIREYDLLTKRSKRPIGRTTIMPRAIGDETSRESFLSYMGGGTVIFDEPRRLQEQITGLLKETPELKGKIIPSEDLFAATDKLNAVYATFMPRKIPGISPDNMISVTVTAMMPFHRQMEVLEEEITRWLGQEQNILVLLGDSQKADSLREHLAKKRIPSSHGTPGSELNGKLVNIQVGRLNSGFELPSAHLVVITERDIFGRVKKKIKRIGSGENVISHFRDIKPGDYVVHVNHGVGKYVGVETLNVGGIHKDYLRIKYGGDDKLFVPTDQVNMLQKFVGGEGETPRLSHLNSTEWTKAKSKARATVENIAHKLIELYARRREAKGFAFSPDGSMQREFEEAFPYEETPDQLKAIAEIKADMEKPRPMDRLLCGDVGFGKTEVAIRAAYKAVLDHKQVAVLVPTTVLAQQHYQTFAARFADFDVNIGVICRFQTQKEQRETLKKVKAGQIDILIGTHAILNTKRVVFARLGLLVVDEEQRFGVKQKEKVKAVAAGVDVLTLSATPIPRTLHMSLAGTRDMSVIETAPGDRFPVQSYVIENRDAVVASAIRREIKRGGQVYFVYNRVETIDKIRAHLQELVPEAKIMTAHGQMDEDLLEQVMLDFYEGRYDVLLATTIIENGLDVPNANTIIIYDADHYGLSQLYQMRGRVGRSRRIAFAYFVYQPNKVLSEGGEKRLQAMKEFAELGAGFKIAMRDMEIRGAGNILGAEQHGHIASVGFEMYCKLLEEAVERLRTGKELEEVPEPIIDLKIEAYIDDAYIDDAMHKIEVYQRVAAVRTNEEVEALGAELKDRFGELPVGVKNLLAVAGLKNYARRVGIRAILEQSLRLEFATVDEPHLEPAGVIKLEKIFGKNLQMQPNQHRMYFKLFDSGRRDILGFALKITKTLAGEETA